MVQEAVLQEIEAGDLRVFVVWEPILRLDDERAARKATALFPDSRVEHFWAPNASVGELFQQPVALDSEPAWDVYLVYDRGVRWVGPHPPVPTYYMHRLRGRLPDSQILDGEKLAEQIRRFLH